MSKIPRGVVLYLLIGPSQLHLCFGDKSPGNRVGIVVFLHCKRVKRDKSDLTFVPGSLLLIFHLPSSNVHVGRI